MSKVTLIIADRSFLIRKGMGVLVGKLEEVEIVREVENKYELEGAINKLTPDVLILSPDLLNDSGSDFKQVLDSCKAMKLILLQTNFEKITDKDIRVDAVISYSEPQSEIITKIREVTNSLKSPESLERDNETLSSREKIILQQVAQGLTNKEIADRLFISVHTVITHRKNITQKLGIKSVSGLTVYAILNGLISMDEVK